MMECVKSLQGDNAEVEASIHFSIMREAALVFRWIVNGKNDGTTSHISNNFLDTSERPK